MRLGTYEYTKTKKGILTVGQLIKALEGLDASTQIVIGDLDGWYYNIDGFHTPSEDGYSALTFNQGDPCNSRQF
jgi:hypothetical protein